MVQPETSKIFRNYDMCYQVYLFDIVVFSLKGIIVNKKPENLFNMMKSQIVFFRFLC